MSYIQAEKDFRQICKDFGLNRIKICSKQRYGYIVEQRRIAIKALDALGYSSGMIGHVTNKDHTTILYHLNHLKRGKKND